MLASSAGFLILARRNYRGKKFFSTENATKALPAGRASCFAHTLRTAQRALTEQQYTTASSGHQLRVDGLLRAVLAFVSTTKGDSSMDPNIQILLALLGAAVLILVALAHTVNAMGNLCSAVARFVIRFRRLMKVIDRRK